MGFRSPAGIVIVAGPMPALVDCFIFCSLLTSRSAVTKTMLVPLRLSAQAPAASSIMEARNTSAARGLRLIMKIEAMLWIVVFILVALAFLFPKTRAFSLSAIGVAIFAIVVIVVVAKRGEPVAVVAATPRAVEQRPIDFERFHVENLDKADPEAKNRIRVAEIRFDQIRAEAGAERGSIGRIVARLYNDSATFILTDYGYDLVVQDCIRGTCTTVFEQHGLSAASVPPNQARDVEIAVRDGNTRDQPPIKILGTANVLLTPTAARAQPISNAKL
jgi:hypothetical protein